MKLNAFQLLNTGLLANFAYQGEMWKASFFGFIFFICQARRAMQAKYEMMNLKQVWLSADLQSIYLKSFHQASLPE